MRDHWEGIRELPHSECSEEWVRVSNKVSLRVLTWEPVDKTLHGLEPIVMVPGWGSVYQGWKPLITEWVRRRRVIYIETREKGSARFEGSRVSVEDFSIENFSQDIVEVLAHYNLKNEFHLFSSSLGSTLLIDALQKQVLDAKSSLFVAPNKNFKFPLWARIMIKMPLPIFTLKVMRNIAVWALERKVKEEGQRIRYRRAMMAQDLVRCRLSARSLMPYSLPDDLSSIRVPCGVIAAQSDKLHRMDSVKNIVERIPGAAMIEVPSNQYAHEADVLVEIDAFYASL